MRIDRIPLGYHEIEAASQLVSEDPEWLPLTCKTLKLDPWMVPAVQEVIRQQRWRSSPNPIGYIRTAARREAMRLGLRDDAYRYSGDRRCPCGAMKKSDAKSRGHACEFPAREIGSIDFTSPEYSRAMDRLGFLAAFDDCEDPEFQVYDDATGVLYSGEPYLRYVPAHMVKRIEPRANNPIFANADAPLEGHYSYGEIHDGQLQIDWDKVASNLPIRDQHKVVVATVLELRFSRGWSLAAICDAPDWVTGFRGRSEQRRLRFQAAWRMIDRQMANIKAAIFSKPPEKEQRYIPREYDHFRSWPEGGGPIRPPLRNRH